MNSPKTARPARRLTVDGVRQRIVECERCPRLRAYCAEVARQKRAAYREWTYWGRPVPGFGDVEAGVLVLGLAPAAHGANRTGRVFTGDGVGGSGDFLMAALHRAGLASRPTSQHPDDGLALRGVYIAAAVRCAPPGNKPGPDEIAACLDHLDAELHVLPRLHTVVALGRIAWDAWLRLAGRYRDVPRPRPAFGHGARVDMTAWSDTGTRRQLPRVLVGCYHPSRQNTNTGTVTPAMYDAVFGSLQAAPAARRRTPKGGQRPGSMDWIKGSGPAR